MMICFCPACSTARGVPSNWARHAQLSTTFFRLNDRVQTNTIALCDLMVRGLCRRPGAMNFPHQNHDACSCAQVDDSKRACRLTNNSKCHVSQNEHRHRFHRYRVKQMKTHLYHGCLRVVWLHRLYNARVSCRRLDCSTADQTAFWQAI